MIPVSEMVSFVRPALILLCAMLLFNLPTLIYKIGMFLQGTMYLLFCNDKKWRKPQDPSIVVNSILEKENELSDHDKVVERKTVYFVRHGESTWNDTFNKGSHRSKAAFVIGFVPGLIKSFLFETYLILSGKMDRCVNQINIGCMSYLSAAINLIFLSSLQSLISVMTIYIGTLFYELSK